MRYLITWFRSVGSLCMFVLVAAAAHSQCVDPGTVINLRTAGNTTDPGYVTAYVLTDNSGKIIGKVSSGFPAPNINGNYRIYTINYRTGGAYMAPNLGKGTDITAIGGTCVAGTGTYLNLCVANGCVLPGTTLNLRTFGNNKTADFVTYYVVTDHTDKILSSGTSPAISAPAVKGSYKIYTVNYESTVGKTAPNLASGTSMLRIGGSCVSLGKDPIEICVEVSLPVKLVSFDAKKEGATVTMDWSTSEEVNANHFEIERSGDATHWNKIGEVTATGESKVTREYRFADVSPMNLTNYYRLKMVDHDLSFAYSRIREVAFDIMHPKMVLYPNPASNALFFKDIDFQNAKSLTVTNVQGEVVLRNGALSPAGISVSNLKPGLYGVKVEFLDGKQETSKVMIAR